MLGYDAYYNQSIRKYVSAFGDLFNNITIVRTDDRVGEDNKYIKIPIAFSDKQDLIVKSKDQSNIDGVTNVRMLLPRMGFSMTNLQYDSDRQRSPIQKHFKSKVGDNTEATMMFEPAPYDIGFELYIATKTINDALQIIEQIIPFFTPSFTLNIKDNPLKPDSGSVDAKLILQSATQEIQGEGSFNDPRFIVWTLSFTMNSFIYGPTGDAELITNAIANIRDDIRIKTEENLLIKYDVKPDPLSADLDDDYDYTETYTEYE